MAKNDENIVDENAVDDENKNDQENADNEEVETDDDQDDKSTKTIDRVDDDLDDDDDAETEVLEPELVALAMAQGMTRADAESRSRISLLSYLEAKARLMKEKEKEPESDPFILKIDPDVLEALPAPLVSEINRIAQAARDGIKSARDEVGPLKAQVEQLVMHTRDAIARESFDAFIRWCDDQDDDWLGSQEKSNHKNREKLLSKVQALGKASPSLSVEDACEIAYRKMFKGKRRQQARREVAEAAAKQSSNAIGRGASTTRASVNGSTTQASVQRLRELFRK